MKNQISILLQDLLSCDAYFILLHMKSSIKPGKSCIALSTRTFQKTLSISKRRVLKGLKELKDMEVIEEVSKARYWDGRNLSPMYVVRDGVFTIESIESYKEGASEAGMPLRMYCQQRRSKRIAMVKAEEKRLRDEKKAQKHSDEIKIA